MRMVRNILVIQTAFIGDVILTLPLLQTLKEFFAGARIDFVAVPKAAEVCMSHPAIDELIVYDKRGVDRGFAGLRKLAQLLRGKSYDLAVVPHRSIRSALLAFASGAPIRIGFNRSAGRFLLTKVVPYRKDLHEVDRNISLLEGIGIRDVGKVLPGVFPQESDRKRVDALLAEFRIKGRDRLVAIAPGTIWNTKRWPKEHFAALAGELAKDRFSVVLIGGPDDVELCSQIKDSSGAGAVYNTAGMLSLLQSAELIRRCAVLISNDSAPMHLGVAVRTPVVALFGATVPEFGFAPIGDRDVVVETRGLRCRPCSSHGGDRCPIGTFECMLAIKPERVLAKMKSVLENKDRTS